MKKIEFIEKYGEEAYKRALEKSKKSSKANREKIRICGVYQIINMITGDCYIGSSKNCIMRMRNEATVSKYNQGPTGITTALQEYPREAFMCRILEECPEELLTLREQYWIDIMKPAYNSKRAISVKKAKKLEANS